MVERHAPKGGSSLPSCLARMVCAVCLAFTCVPAAALSGVLSGVGSAWADDALVFASWVDVATDPGEAPQQVQMFFTVQPDGKTVKVGRNNSASGASYAIDAGFDRMVVIPEKVTHDTYGTFEVTGIQDYAFGSSAVNGVHSQLAGVRIPASVKEIGTYAFAWCPLAKVELSTYEGSEASALTDIGQFAFFRTGVEEITIPSSVKTLGTSAFQYCDKLAKVEFADVDNSALTDMGSGCFQISTTSGGALGEIVLPAGLKSIPAKAFAYQGSLKHVQILGDKQGMEFTIGQDAFQNCKSLEYVEIPQLSETGKTGAYQASIAPGAFYNCTALATVVFKGNMAKVSVAGNGVEAAFYGCDSLETVVYHGSVLPGMGNTDAKFSGGMGPGQERNDSATNATPFFDWLLARELTYYYNVVFYDENPVNEDGTVNADAQAISSARVRDDVTISQIKDQVAGRDSTLFKGEQVYDDNGQLPDSRYAGVAWAFQAGFVDSSMLSSSVYAYAPDTSGKVDVKSCNISLRLHSFVSGTQPVTVGYSITTPTGVAPVLKTDYTLGLAMLDASTGEWKAAQEVGINDLSKVTNPGSYRLYFMSTESGMLTGQTYASFEVAKAIDSMHSFSTYVWGTTGKGAAYPAHYLYKSSGMGLEAEFGQCDFGILVSVDDPWGLAASLWLSRSLGGAVIIPYDAATFDGSYDLAMTIVRNRVKANGRILIMGDESVISGEVKDVVESAMSDSTSRLSYPKGGEAAGVAMAVRSFTNIGAKCGSTAYVIASDAEGGNVAAYGALLNSCYSFEQSDPIFFCGEDGSLDPETRFVLKTGGFDRVVMVGESDAGLGWLEHQVSNSSMTFDSLVGTPQQLSRDANKSYFGKSSDGCAVVYVSPTESNGAQAVVASLAASYRNATLVFVGSLDEAKSYVPELMTEERVLRTPYNYFIGTNDSEEAQSFLQGLAEIVNTQYGAVYEEEGGEGDAENVD